MRKLEREALIADRETVRALLASISEHDPIGRLSFEARLAEIEQQLAKLQAPETTGSVALLFAGTPVDGSHAIDAEFASAALKTFQDLVTKRIAAEEVGKLGARGRVPVRTSSNLAITELMRGSVGFALEERGENLELADTSVKKAIDEVTDVIARTASEDVRDFEQAVETLDARLIVSLRDFFKTLDEQHATVRIVEDQRDEILDATAVRRGRERIEMTEIQEVESETVIGELMGLLPDSRRFEMKLRDTGEVIKGTVGPALANRWLELIEAPDQDIVGRMWRTKMRIREIRERNKPPRKLYALLGLIEKVAIK